MTTFLFTGSVQSFTVPVAGEYYILCAGAQGGNTTKANETYYGGLGAVVENFVVCRQGQVLDFVVGGKGNDGVGAGGGGGGSFVYSPGYLIEAAGGGGGAGSDSNGGNAQIFSDSIVEVPTGSYNNTVTQRVITGMNGSTGLVADVSYGAAGSGGEGGLGGGGGAGQWGGGGGGAGWGGDGVNGGAWGLPDYRPVSVVYEPPTYSHLYGGQGGTGKSTFLGGAGSIDSQAGSGGYGGGGGAGVHYDVAFGYTFYAGGGGGGFSGGGGGQASGGGGGGSFVLNSTPHSDSTRTNAGNGCVMINLTREYLSDRHRAYDTDAYENAGAVVRLFNTALARPHDHEGAGFWVKALDKGTALTVVADAILSSEEYRYINGGDQTNTEFVEMLYNNALHRNPDQTGEAFWLSLLDSGSATRAGVLIDIGESAESIQANAALVANGVLFQEWL